MQCDAVKDENGTSERKRIIYDTKTSAFTEIDRVLDLAEKNPKRVTISKSEFIGKCDKALLVLNKSKD